MLHNNLKSTTLRIDTKLVSPRVMCMQYAYIINNPTIRRIYIYIYIYERGLLRERGNDPGVTMDNGYGPIFLRPTGNGTGLHWGFVGWPTMESKAADSTVAHFSCKREQQELLEQQDQQEQQAYAIGCYTKTFRLTALAQQDMQEQQDTQPGQQDTRLDYRIHGWTTGYTAKQQDTWLDFRIHSQTTGYMAGLQDTQPDTGIRGHSTATAPYSSRDERQT